jgi:hypothetical protein
MTKLMTAGAALLFVTLIDLSVDAYNLLILCSTGDRGKGDTLMSLLLTFSVDDLCGFLIFLLALIASLRIDVARSFAT